MFNNIYPLASPPYAQVALTVIVLDFETPSVKALGDSSLKSHFLVPESAKAVMKA